MNAKEQEIQELKSEVEILKVRLETAYRGFDQLEALKHSINIDRECLRQVNIKQMERIEELNSELEKINKKKSSGMP